MEEYIFHCTSGTPKEIFEGTGQLIHSEQIEQLLKMSAKSEKPFVIGVYQRPNYVENARSRLNFFLALEKDQNERDIGIIRALTKGGIDNAHPHLINIIYHEMCISEDMISWAAKRNAPSERILCNDYSTFPDYGEKLDNINSSFKEKVLEAVRFGMSTGNFESKLERLEKLSETLEECQTKYGLTRNESSIHLSMKKIIEINIQKDGNYSVPEEFLDDFILNHKFF